MLEELRGRWREGQELGKAKLEKQGGANRAGVDYVRNPAISLTAIACARSVVSDSAAP